MTTAIELSAFQLPVHDDRFIRLGDDLRHFIKERLDALREIAGARRVAAAVREISKRRAGRRGWGRGTLMNLWYRFIKSLDWTVLLDKARAGAVWWSNAANGGLPPAFREHLGQQWCLRQRGKFRPVWVDLKAQLTDWERGAAAARIPGYTECPPRRSDTNLPDGWTYENLLKTAKREADRYSRKLIQQGPKAAAQFTPKIHTTRVGVEVGQYYLFDDSWNDFRVLFRGHGSRILSLHCLDLASACNVLAGHKPTIEADGATERLKEREMIFLVAALFSTIGYRPAGTTCICEMGTATIRETEADLLDKMCGIKVQTGPAGGGPGIAGLMAERGGGNPRWKAPMESFFNLLRNRTDHLLEFPGQLGSNSRLNLPEGTAAMEKQDEAMSRALALLPEERRREIQFNLLQYENAVPILDTRIEFCNTRRDHELEGWRKSGNISPAFRLSPTTEWLPIRLVDKLTPDQQAQLKLMLQADPALTGEISLSPREVFTRSAASLKRFTAAETALFLAGAPGLERPVERGEIEVGCPEVNQDEPLRYGPVLRDGQGREEVLRPDDTYLVRVNPYAPQHAFLYNAKGGYVGIARQSGLGTRADVAALTEQFKTKQKAVSQWTQKARQLAAPITEKAVKRVKQNAAVIASDAAAKQNLNTLAEQALMANATQP